VRCTVRAYARVCARVPLALGRLQSKNNLHGAAELKYTVIPALEVRCQSRLHGFASLVRSPGIAVHRALAARAPAPPIAPPPPMLCSVPCVVAEPNCAADRRAKKRGGGRPHAAAPRAGPRADCGGGVQVDWGPKCVAVGIGLRVCLPHACGSVPSVVAWRLLLTVLRMFRTRVSPRSACPTPAACSEPSHSERPRPRVEPGRPLAGAGDWARGGGEERGVGHSAVPCGDEQRGSAAGRVHVPGACVRTLLMNVGPGSHQLHDGCCGGFGARAYVLFAPPLPTASLPRRLSCSWTGPHGRG
jgi:hypothetical protein